MHAHARAARGQQQQQGEATRPARLSFSSLSSGHHLQRAHHTVEEATKESHRRGDLLAADERLWCPPAVCPAGGATTPPQLLLPPRFASGLMLLDGACGAALRMGARRRPLQRCTGGSVERQGCVRRSFYSRLGAVPEQQADVDSALEREGHEPHLQRRSWRWLRNAAGPKLAAAFTQACNAARFRMRRPR